MDRITVSRLLVRAEFLLGTDILLRLAEAETRFGSTCQGDGVWMAFFELVFAHESYESVAISKSCESPSISHSANHGEGHL